MVLNHEENSYCMCLVTLPSEPSTLSMHGKEVFKFAVERLYTCARDLMQRHNIPSDSIDWVVPHQANIRILDQVSRQIGISPDRIVKTLDQHANTSAASIPCATHLLQSGNLKRGQRILFNAFGSGFTWGAAVCDF